MRLIDADALKAQIDKASCEWLEQGGLNELNLVQQGIMLVLIETVRNGFCGEIDKAPTAQMWVPCEERLPEKDGWYITTFESDDGSRCTTPAKYMSDIGKWVVFWGKVVAWVPYPEPLKGEEKENE